MFTSQFSLMRIGNDISTCKHKGSQPFCPLFCLTLRVAGIENYQETVFCTCVCPYAYVSSVFTCLSLCLCSCPSENQTLKLNFFPGKHNMSQFSLMRIGNDISTCKHKGSQPFCPLFCLTLRVAGIENYKETVFCTCVCPYAYVSSVFTCLSLCLCSCPSENQTLKLNFFPGKHNMQYQAKTFLPC